jgi:DNA-binding NarL/FixJ family response regulator
MNMPELSLPVPGPVESAPVATIEGRVVVSPPSAQHPPTSAPDALLIELDRMIEVDPLRLCRETAMTSPTTAIIGVGSEDRLADGFQLLRLGAVSWVTEDATTGIDRAEAVATTLAGGSVLAPRHAAWVLADFAAMTDQSDGPDPRVTLTATEREVLTRLAKGQTAADIATFHDVETPLVHRHVRLALNRLQRRR